MGWVCVNRMYVPIAREDDRAVFLTNLTSSAENEKPTQLRSSVLVLVLVEFLILFYRVL